MRKINLILTLGILLMTYARADNLLRNGNFEQGMSGWEVPSWIKNTLTPETDSVVNAGGGSMSMKFKGMKGKRGIVLSHFLIPKGTRYLQVSLMARTRDLGHTYAGAFLEIQNLKKSPWSISTYERSANKRESGWMEFSGTVELPPGAGPMGKIYLHMAPGAEGTVWFDDIVINPLNADKKTVVMQAKTPKKTVAGKSNEPFSGLKQSSENILDPEWSLISWLPQAVVPVQKNGSLQFQIAAGQRALVEQRIMSIARNCEGPFRFSAWIKTPPYLFPSMNVTIYPIYTVKRKNMNVAAKATGAEKNGFREFACEFVAPPQTGEIRPVIGIIGKASRKGEVNIREIALRPLVENGQEISLWHAGNDARQGIFYPEETPFAELRFKNPTKQKQKLCLQGSVRNLRGKEIQNFSAMVNLPPQEISTHRIKFPNQNRPGFYSVHLRWDSRKGMKKTICTYVITTPLTGKADPLFGITFMARDEEYAEAMKRLGCGTKGLFVMRDAVEQMDGSFRWEHTDRALAALVKAGIEPVGGIEITSMRIPARYLAEIRERTRCGKTPFSAAYYEGATRFEEAMFRRYRGKIRKWSVIGEINLLKNHSPYEYEHYIRRVKNCYRTMKRVAPENLLSGIGCSGEDGRALPRYPVLRDLWFNQGLAESLDGLGIDQYTSPHAYGPGYQPVNSETGQIREIMLEALKIARTKGKDKHLSIDEKGFKIVQSLPADSPYAVQMAENLARYYVTLKGIHEVEHFLYFMWKRWRAGEEFDYGLWLDYFPRPTVAAYAATARMIGNAKFLRRLELHADVPCHVFEKNGKRIVALWLGGTAQGKAGLSMKAPSGLEILDMEGNPLKPQISQGKLLLQLDSAPIYLRTDMSADVLIALLKAAVVELPSVRMEIAPKNAARLDIIVKNLISVPVSGKLSIKNRLTDWHENYTVPAYGIFKRSIPLKNDNPANLSGFRFVLSNTTRNGQFFSLEKNFTVHRIPRANSMASTAALKPLIVLDNGELYLNIPDYISKGVWKGPADCSAELRMGYSQYNLYLHVRVRDDHHANEKVTPDTLWAGDAVQFAFDSLADASEKALNGKNGLFGDDHFFTAALGRGKPRMFCHKSGCSADWTGYTPVIRRDEASGTTIYEITLPWKKLLPICPERKQFFGFNFIVLDSDNPAKAPPYWMQLTPGIAGGQKPEKYHLFVLE